MTGRAAVAVDAFLALERAERKVEARQADLQRALAQMGPDDLAEYAAATTP